MPKNRKGIQAHCTVELSEVCAVFDKWSGARKKKKGGRVPRGVLKAMYERLPTEGFQAWKEWIHSKIPMRAD